MIRRTSFPRGAPPQRRSEIKRGGRVNPINRKRKAKRLETDFGGKAYLEFIHGLECAVCGAPCELTEAAHVRSRGAGGKAEDIVPLCGTRFGVKGCHRRYDEHEIGTRRHEPRLRSLAKRLRQQFLNNQTEEME